MVGCEFEDEVEGELTLLGGLIFALPRPEIIFSEFLPDESCQNSP